MKRKYHLQGDLLSSVIVFSVLMLLVVLAVMSLWELDFLLFSRARHLQEQRAHIESGFILYCRYPGILERVEADSTYLLYDSVPSSRIRITRRPWGLYEAVSIATGGIRCRNGLLGVQRPYKKPGVLWYGNHQGAITLTGDSHIKGIVYLPDKGVIYGQMQSQFFTGEKLPAQDIYKSEQEQLPAPLPEARTYITCLFSLLEQENTEITDTTHSFALPEPRISYLPDKTEVSGLLSGHIILVGKTLRLTAESALYHPLVIGEKIVIEDNFRGAVQVFATDTIIAGENVVLEYPSGLYCEKFIRIGCHSQINGYVILHHTGENEILKANLIQSRLSTVRGLLYCNGIAQIQGIISGMALLKRAVYYSPRGYYQDMLYDATLLTNNEVAYPLWLDSPVERKEAAWVP